MASVSIEAVFNNEFAKLLSEVSGQPKGAIVAEKDRTIEGSTKRPDLLLDRPGLPPFVVEAKFAESPGDPTENARKKIGLKCSSENRHIAGLTVRSAAALRYPKGSNTWEPDEMRGRFLSGEAELEWKLLSEQNGEADVFPKQGWIKGDIWDFWESISRTAMNVEATEKLGETVTNLLKASASHMLSVLGNLPGEQKRIAVDMGEPEDVKAGMEIACVVWLDALLMMNELAWEQKPLRPDGSAVLNFDACRHRNGEPDVSKIFGEWNKVLGENYESIFKPAKTALPHPAIPFSSMTQAFVFLFEAASEIETARLGKIANIGGEIFARVMDSQQRKKSASFYTKPQVAEFLAALTVPSEDVLPADWKEWKTADFACGTGSLLRAAYRRLTRFAAKRNIHPERFHKHMMENNLYGLDVSCIASHLSATTIVNLFPAISYKNMQIGPMEFGVKGGVTYAGSLEIADSKSSGALFNENFVSLKGDTDSEDGVSRVDAPDDSFASVIMNPPYSRTRGGQAVADLSGISESERKQIQKRISVLRKKTLGNGKAGLASDFLALAFQKLRDGGRMGFVLPLTAAAAGSYLEIRDYLIENFSDITVSFNDASLSDDTNMGEIMLTATKGKNGRPGVRYVKLDGDFPSASYAAECARQISQTEADVIKGETEGTLYVGGDRIGEWVCCDNPLAVWGLAGSTDLHGISSEAELMAGGHLIASDADVRFSVTQLGSLLDVCSTHDKIGFLAKIASKDGIKEGNKRGAFRWHEIASANDTRKKDLSLWHAKHNLCTSVNVKPTHYGIEYAPDKSAKIREEKTDLFIQRNMRWNSQKILAGRTGRECFGGSSWVGFPKRMMS